MKKRLRYIIPVLAFLFVWAVFPIQWLLDLGLDAVCVGLLQLMTLICIVWVIAGRMQLDSTCDDE